MKVTVLGATGLLGIDLVKLLRSRGHTVNALGSKDLDIVDHQAVKEHSALTKKNADWVINCAAYTKVDLAESEPERAKDVNEEGVLNLCERLQTGPRLLHISTDFVFDGSKTNPYLESDETNPIGIYGQTKLQGEHYVEAMLDDAVIFRTSWLFGAHGPCFPKTMIRLYDSGNDLKVVADQIGCPTCAQDLALAIAFAIENRLEAGLYHACGNDAMSWHAFAEIVLSEHAGRPVSIRAVETKDFATAAQRPAYSVMSNKKLTKTGISPWQSTVDAVSDLLDN